MNQKTVLITGISGMLGKDIAELFYQDQDYRVFGAAREDFNHFCDKTYVGDLTDGNFIDQVLAATKPEIIIHCAAIVDVDGCEKNRQLADKLHVEATRQLASYPAARFVYISTDSVFDGKKGDYTENDSPNPLNYYAQSKLLGEKAALDSNGKTLVLRTNIYGFHLPGGKSLVEWAINNLNENKEISGFDDVYFNPLYTKQLAAVVKALIRTTDFTGIVNSTSDQRVSKYKFLREIAEAFNLPSSLISPSSVENTIFAAPRPKNTTLKNTLLKSLIKTDLSLTEGLKQLAKDYNEAKS